VQGLGPRFALEVAFLIALAIGAGFAELSPTAIVAVMGLAWLLICLFELAVWAEGPRFPALDRRPRAVAEPEQEPPAETTEIRAAEQAPRRRFWRRGRAASGEGA
jgi:hypothetical protein